jgi:hypothetical protein
MEGAGTLTLAGPVVHGTAARNRVSRINEPIVTGGSGPWLRAVGCCNGRTMSLDTNTQWTAGNWQISGGATIINEPGRTWDIANVFLDDIDAASTETIINRGILRKSSSIGTATLEFDLLDHQDGAQVEATIGVIGMTGSFVSRGHWHVADGATIDWQQQSASSELRTGTLPPEPGVCGCKPDWFLSWTMSL